MEVFPDWEFAGQAAFFLPTDEAFGDQCTGLELAKVALPVRAKEPGEGASPHA